MSAISSLGASPNDLLAALRQQLLGKLNPNGALGQIDSDGDSDGSGGNPQSQTATAAAPVTGSGVGQFDSTLLMLLVKLQEQPAQPSAAVTAVDPTQSAAVQLTPRQQQLFAAIDTNGDGTISKSELTAAFTTAGLDPANADALFAKLDTNGDGAVSTSEFAAALPFHGHHAPHLAGGGDGASGGLAQALLQATAGDTTTTVNNPDGSTTTTITYADGTSITLNTPAQSQDSGGPNGAAAPSDAGPSSGSGGTSPTASGGAQDPKTMEALLELLIRLEAQAAQTAQAAGAPGATA